MLRYLLVDPTGHATSWQERGDGAAAEAFANQLAKATVGVK
jgi:hypothetical protein